MLLKNLNVDADADSSAIALPGLHPGELKNLFSATFYWNFTMKLMLGIQLKRQDGTHYFSTWFC